MPRIAAAPAWIARSRAFIALAACIGAVACDAAPPQAQPTPAQEPAAVTLETFDSLGGDFSLTSHRGQPYSLSDDLGKIVLLYFGYTFCPDACPTTFSKISQVRRALGDHAGMVRAVLVSVDPARDTPAALSEYLSQFDLDATGLTGDRTSIDQVLARYGAASELPAAPAAGDRSATGYLVNHSTYLYLIDQQGKLRYIFKHDDGVDRIEAGVRALLTP